jgi:hypothetical protein
VDGYANGWRLGGSTGTYTVHLRWTPQRRVWLALWLSLAGVILCLGIVLASIVRRRRSGDADPDSSVPDPVLPPRWWATGPPPSVIRTGVAATGIALAAGIVVHPLFGLAAGIVALGSLRLPYGRAVGLGAPAFVLAAMGFTIEVQRRHGYPPDFGWADFFHPAHYLAWAALWCAVVALVTDRLRRGRAGDADTVQR